MKPRDLLPNLPHEGPPIPRFLMRPADENIPKEESRHEHRHEQVTTQQTIDYQNRELAKTLLALETHLSQGCRIDGMPCDCCSGRHPLELEKLSEEALSMNADPVYHRIIELANEIERKANVEAIRSGEYTDEYPQLAVKARQLRKQVMGSLSAEEKAKLALKMVKEGGLKTS